MKSVDSMNNTELNDYIDTLERTKTNKSKELIKNKQGITGNRREFTESYGGER